MLGNATQTSGWALFIKLAIRILSIVGNTASVERNFSIFGTTRTKLRNCLAPETCHDATLVRQDEVHMFRRNDLLPEHSKRVFHGPKVDSNAVADGSNLEATSDLAESMAQLRTEAANEDKPDEDFDDDEKTLPAVVAASSTSSPGSAGLVSPAILSVARIQKDCNGRRPVPFFQPPGSLEAANSHPFTGGFRADAERRIQEEGDRIADEEAESRQEGIQGSTDA